MPAYKKVSLFNSIPSAGFTLIEILIVVAILLIISAIALASLSVLQKQVDLGSSAQNIVSVLRLARSKTLASENETQYGVHFDTNQYVLFIGNTYNSADATNKIYPLSTTTVSNIALNGAGNEVIFDRIRGTTSEYGTITLTSNADSSRILTISIDSAGQVSLSSTVTTTGSRVADSRHLHFDLSGSGNCSGTNWTIQNATTLTLVWTDPGNPTVTDNIPMAGFFNAGKTVFDWSGTVNVNGSNQTLRIHTHCISATDTILSINRDLRYNTKALTVSIVVSGITKQIVSYNAAGTATVGADGGVMTVQ